MPSVPTITRTAWTDDDGSGTTGTLINNAEKTTLYGQIDAVVAAEDALMRPTVSTVTTTGNITALALPTGSSNLVIYMNNATLATIQGIAAGITGQRLTIVSMGAGQVDLSHQDAAATAANRLINFATVGKTSLAAGIGVAEYEYDVTTARWRLVSHAQGDWISYSGTSTITGWSSRTFSRIVYMLVGRALMVSWYLTGTSNATTTTFTLPYTSQATGSGDAGPGAGVAGLTIDNGAYTATPGQVAVQDSATTVTCYATMARGAWTASGSKTTAGKLTIDVQ